MADVEEFLYFETLSQGQFKNINELKHFIKRNRLKHFQTNVQD